MDDINTVLFPDSPYFDLTDIQLTLSVTSKFNLIMTYALETWVMKENIIQKLLVFERKILREISGATKENQTWRIKNNENWTN
jgi:hypothetical protein